MPFPFMALAGVAAQVLPHLFSDNKEEMPVKALEAAGKAVAAITGTKDPKEALERLEADNALVIQLEEMAQKEMQIHLENTKDARNRDIEMRKLGHKNQRADIMVGVAFICLCFMIWAIWSKDNIPGEILSIFTMAIGAVLKMLSDAFQFEFGSSRSSKDKTIHLSQK